MLKSEIAGGVAGRSTTNFTHDDHVNDENNQRHDYVKHDNFNVTDDTNVILKPTDTLDSLGDQRDQCQTDDDFLGSGCRTQLYRLFTCYIISFQLYCKFCNSFKQKQQQQ